MTIGTRGLNTYSILNHPKYKDAILQIDEKMALDIQGGSTIVENALGSHQDEHEGILKPKKITGGLNLRGNKKL